MTACDKHDSARLWVVFDAVSNRERGQEVPWEACPRDFYHICAPFKILPKHRNFPKSLTAKHFYIILIMSKMT
jgi:hypothetical protein